MKLDTAAPGIIQETRKQAPCPDAARNLGALLALAVGLGCVVALVCRLAGLPLISSLVAGAVVAAIPVVLRFDDMTLQIEESTQYSEAPLALPAPPRTVQVEVHNQDARQWAFMDLPGTQEQLAELARGILNGRTWAETEWTGKGRPYTKSEFRDLRATLLERGFLVWRRVDSPTAGVELSVVGRRVFSQLSDPETTEYTRPGQFRVLPPEEEAMRTSAQLRGGRSAEPPRLLGQGRGDD